jgi:hypothetical protein
MSTKWNFNKFGAQVGHKNGTFVLTKTRLKKLHPIILDEKNCYLYYVASWTHIMIRFLTFTFQRLIIQMQLHWTLWKWIYNNNATQTMDDCMLFSTWISHFM